MQDPVGQPDRRETACLEGLQEAHEQLDAPPLAVADQVHAPVQVDVQHIQQLGLALGVDIRQAIDHLGNREVSLLAKKN